MSSGECRIKTVRDAVLKKNDVELDTEGATRVEWLHCMTLPYLTLPYL